MGWLDKITALFGKKNTISLVSSEEKADVSSEVIDSSEEEQAVRPDEVLTEEEQQVLQIKNFIKSDDIANHELAVMFLQSLDLDWEEELYTLIGKSAEKLTFWAQQQELPAVRKYYRTLVINARFFNQYSEIAEFAKVLPRLENIEELRWEAGPYWNQHPILVAAAQLPKLKRLYVRNCKMHYLPEEICNCNTLEALYLSKNKLTELPQFMEKLRMLRILDLGENQFKRFPKNISTLKRLEVLYLNDNPLLDIEPRFLGRLYKLNDLKLPDNLAKFYVDTLKSWLPEVDFDKSYWQF